jgi:hypothetical protein
MAADKKSQPANSSPTDGGFWAGFRRGVLIEVIGSIGVGALCVSLGSEHMILAVGVGGPLCAFVVATTLRRFARADAPAAPKSSKETTPSQEPF